MLFKLNFGLIVNMENEREVSMTQLFLSQEQLSLLSEVVQDQLMLRSEQLEGSRPGLRKLGESEQEELDELRTLLNTLHSLGSLF